MNQGDSNMEINKLQNHITGPVDNTGNTEQSREAARVNEVDKSADFSDKVSIENHSSRKSERLFAQIELEKLNQGSFDKLKMYKSKLEEYENAKSQSPEAASQTEVGKLLDNPDVWSKIAEGIVG